LYVLDESDLRLMRKSINFIRFIKNYELFILSSTSLCFRMTDLESDLVFPSDSEEYTRTLSKCDDLPSPETQEPAEDKFFEVASDSEI